LLGRSAGRRQGLKGYSLTRKTGASLVQVVSASLANPKASCASLNQPTDWFERSLSTKTCFWLKAIKEAYFLSIT